jgi:hypothetical protein
MHGERPLRSFIPRRRFPVLSSRLRSFSTRAALGMIVTGSALAVPMMFTSSAHAQTNCAPASPAPAPATTRATVAAPATTATTAPTATPTTAAAAVTTVAPVVTVPRPVEGAVIVEAGLTLDAPTTEPVTTVADTVSATVATTVADVPTTAAAAAAIIRAHAPLVVVQARRVSFQAPTCNPWDGVNGAEASGSGDATSLAFTGAKNNDRKAVGGASLLVSGAVLLVGTRSRRAKRNR